MTRTDLAIRQRVAYLRLSAAIGCARPYADDLFHRNDARLRHALSDAHAIVVDGRYTALAHDHVVCVEIIADTIISLITPLACDPKVKTISEVAYDAFNMAANVYHSTRRMR